MLHNILIFIAQATQAINKDGTVNGNYLLNIIVGVCGILVTALITVVFNNLNNSIKSLSANFEKFQQDFHAFVQEQSALNERFKERTKNL